MISIFFGAITMSCWNVGQDGTALGQHKPRRWRVRPGLSSVVLILLKGGRPRWLRFVLNALNVIRLPFRQIPRLSIRAIESSQPATALDDVGRAISPQVSHVGSRDHFPRGYLFNLLSRQKLTGAKVSFVL